MRRAKVESGSLERLREREELPEVFFAKFEETSGVVRLNFSEYGLVGAPLTDASVLADGYRYHDVLHLAFAAVLGWSPVLRHLLRIKRKSQPLIDEEEDGGRAWIVEEAICHIIHVHFEDAGENWQSAIAEVDFLSYVKRLARGFESGRCSTELWQTAIHVGLQSFVALRENGSGVVRGDRRQGTLVFGRSMNAF